MNQKIGQNWPCQIEKHFLPILILPFGLLSILTKLPNISKIRCLRSFDAATTSAWLPALAPPDTLVGGVGGRLFCVFLLLNLVLS